MKYKIKVDKILLKPVEEKLQELEEINKEIGLFQLEKRSRINNLPVPLKIAALQELDNYYDPIIENLNNFSQYIKHEIKALEV